MRTLKVLLDGLAFPEGPRWHDGKFFFSDMHAHQVVAVDMAGERGVIWGGPNRPAGVGWLPAGRNVLGFVTARKLTRPLAARAEKAASTNIPPPLPFYDHL